MTRTTRWDSALVLGGGYAGLLAARVLAGHFRRVTVLEQDRRTDDGHRPGVPQAHHPHALLARGAQELEKLFPGLRTQLLSHNCPVGDFGAMTRISFPGGWAPRAPAGFDVQLVARTMLEQILRDRVAALGPVVLDHCARAGRLLVDHASGRVSVGVHRRGEGEDREELVDADLVVDATGRGSRMPQWLSQAGYRCPPSLVVDGHVAYSSRRYTLTPVPGRDWSASYQPALAPNAPRGGVLARIGTDQWLLALIGAAGHTPPTDDVGFHDYAANLANPDFARIIDDGTPLGPVRRTRATANRWHRYHRVPNWPGRLLALGDSVCALNPVYGQGMTVAALQSTTLDTLLAGRRPGQPPDVGPAFQRAAAALVRAPWLLNTSADRAWDTQDTPLASRLATGYLNALTARIPHDPALFLRFARTMNMLDSPLTLATPAVLARLALPSAQPRHSARQNPGTTPLP
ncbi:FAD-dependent monooxygenase [Kitasatospora sp. NPDC002040]|uniref:NAD(P)/FAD-dependent oxidoreductase n=1 Tax=Kitasatospora sp. NPDC002040 TaxID=3154661 RepID=UPI00332FC7D7